MARSDTQSLRNCPLCMTKLTADIKELMGIRHYQRINSMLPGKVGGMDIDYVLDQSKTGRMLILEFKPSKARLNTGQRLTLKRFREWGADVWVINDGHFKKDATVDVAVMEHDGFIRSWFEGISEDQLAARMSAWWEFGFRNG